MVIQIKLVQCVMFILNGHAVLTGHDCCCCLSACSSLTIARMAETASASATTDSGKQTDCQFAGCRQRQLASCPFPSDQAATDLPSARLDSNISTRSVGSNQGKDCGWRRQPPFCWLAPTLANTRSQAQNSSGTKIES